MTIRKFIATLLLFGAILTPLTSCRWMGEKSGQAANEIEEGAEEFEEGYEDTRD